VSLDNADTVIEGGQLLTPPNWGCPISRVLCEKWAAPLSAPRVEAREARAGAPAGTVGLEQLPAL
jgi:hypothetical protein